MQLTYKNVESTVKPLEIDLSSSAGGVYIRRNIKEVEKETTNGGTQVYYNYQECYLTLDEYEKASRDLLVDEINGEDNTAEYQEYKEKLNTPVLYSNGKYYNPRYIKDYKKIMQDLSVAINLYEKAGGDCSNLLRQTFPVYDATGTVANMVQMTVCEVIELYFFLYNIKEKYFTEYKLAKEQA